MSQSATHGLTHEVVVEQCSERLSVFHLCLLSQTNKAINETMMLAPCWKALFIEAVKVFSVFLSCSTHDALFNSVDTFSP